jgi:stearoyl-CoA desaturase (delta-9 desaturase)
MQDAWWQLHCDLHLENPPIFQPEERIKADRFYHFMERTWMLQQLPWAMLLFYGGGISWVIWGISARVAISVSGHWLIGYFAHNHGARDWHVEGAVVQGHNVRFAGLIAMDESWHNNHHAFPGSALLGIYQHQVDPGWWVLNFLHNLGLVWNIQLPHDLLIREEVHPLNQFLTNSYPLQGVKNCPRLQALSIKKT